MSINDIVGILLMAGLGLFGLLVLLFVIYFGVLKKRANHPRNPPDKSGGEQMNQ